MKLSRLAFATVVLALPESRDKLQGAGVALFEDSQENFSAASFTPKSGSGATW